VDLTGGVSVGRECFFGSGARVIPYTAIGERCSIGAGAVVVRRARDDATLFAAPARSL
jgi:acetyltransferase-like isoleucine patch superfamily enzyme